MNVRLRIYQVLLFKFRRHLCKGSITECNLLLKVLNQQKFKRSVICRFAYENGHKGSTLDNDSCYVATTLKYKTQAH